MRCRGDDPDTNLLLGLKTLDTILPSRKKITWWKSGLRCGYCKCIHLQYYNVGFSILKTYLLILTSSLKPDWGVWVSVYLPVWKSSDIFGALLSFIFNLQNCKRYKHMHYGCIGLHFFVRFLVRQRVDSQKETYTVNCIIRKTWYQISIKWVNNRVARRNYSKVGYFVHQLEMLTLHEPYIDWLPPALFHVRCTALWILQWIFKGIS